ncbi:NUMOD4 domain-containing protein [Limosilactobacillus fermentum]
MEQWKTVDKVPNYEVSSNGCVRSKKTNKLLKAHKNHKGYLEVRLSYKHQKYSLKIHRLVAEAFIDNPNNYLQVNHKDECKTNNSVDNLEWCTAKYNCNYGTRNMRRVRHTNFEARNKTYGYRHRLDNFDWSKHNQQLDIPIKAIDSNGRVVKEYSSISEAARDLGKSSGHISEAVRGKRKSAYGYSWVPSKASVGYTD